MLNTIKRLLAGPRAPGGWSEVKHWAERQGAAFKRSRDGSGFVIGLGTPDTATRLEWGPSHRSYISGHELRMRSDLAGNANLQMLVLTRALMEALEKQVYAQAGASSKADDERGAPEEMRWLVLYTKLTAFGIAGLSESFGAVASVPQAASMWLDGALGEHLVAARSSWLDPAQPLALVVHHARVTLRTAMHEPNAARIEALVELFQIARNEARRVADQWNWSRNASTLPSLFSPHPELRNPGKG